MITYNDVEESTTGKFGRKKSDVAIMGVPFDVGTDNHAGQRNGPHAIRNAGFWVDNMRHAQTQVDPMSGLVVVDVGDIESVPGQDASALWAATRTQAALVKSNTGVLISIGGDHSFTAKIAAGVSQDDGHPLTIFHFDAHTDYWQHDPGVEMNHGTWVRRVIDEGVANRVVQFGVRGWGVGEVDRRWADKNDIDTYYANTSNWMGKLQEELADCSDHIYLSIDLDVLDPAFAPGVAFQEPGGITSRELLNAIMLIASDKRMVAADVMECIPDRDPTGITAKIGSRCVAQLLTGIASR